MQIRKLYGIEQWALDLVSVDHFTKETTPPKDHFLVRTEYFSLFYVLLCFDNKTGFLVRAPLKDHVYVPIKTLQLKRCILLFFQMKGGGYTNR